jgi:lysophospholipase L1-like esterase
MADSVVVSEANGPTSERSAQVTIGTRAMVILHPLVWLGILSFSFYSYVRLREDYALLALALLLGFLVAAVRFYDLANEVLASPYVGTKLRVAVCALIFAVGAFILATSDAEGLWIYGFMIAYLGAGLAIVSVRRTKATLVVGAVFTAGCVFAWTVGLMALRIGGNEWWFYVLGPSLLLTPIGLSLISGSDTPFNYVSRQKRARWIVLAVCILAVALAVAIAIDLLGSGLGVGVSLGAAALMLAVVTRSNVDLLLIVVLAAVVWTFAQVEVDNPDELVVDASLSSYPVLVALGDSYISGEGADSFLQDTNSGDRKCRRAATAYPMILSSAPNSAFPDRLVFQACTGALISDVEGQLAALTALKIPTANVKIVLVSAGGNDAMFGVLGRTCLLPGDCADFEAAFRGYLEFVRSELADFYKTLSNTTAFPADLIAVVPYPVPISDDKIYVDDRPCKYSTLSAGEHRFLYNYTLALNAIVIGEARAAGLAVVDTMPAALEKASGRVCDGPARQAAVNFIALNSIQGSLDQSVMPYNWIHNSLHPNAKGHRVMATAISDWCGHGTNDGSSTSEDVCPALGEPSTLPASVPEPAATTGQCIQDTWNEQSRSKLERCVYKDAYRSTATALIFPGSFVLIGLLGLWALALAATSFVRQKTGDPWSPGGTLDAYP